MDRQHTKIGRISDFQKDDFVPGSMADRIRMVWPLTREVASLSKQHDAEQRLQRHVTRLSRRTKDLADVEALQSLRDKTQPDSQ